MREEAVLTGDHFMLGDHAAVEGALAAGCRFFAGYPITPASEVAERMSGRMHRIGGEYIQMEDEIASMAAIIGASCTGAKSMTATSGPGFSLMMENIGLAFMLEVPCVILNIMRGGPSTGMPTLTSQGDMMQVRWGSHGDYEVIAFCPSSVQEMFDFTIKAFNASEKYRMPAFVMGDQILGHMTGKVSIPPKDEIHVVDRKTAKNRRIIGKTDEMDSGVGGGRGKDAEVKDVEGKNAKVKDVEGKEAGGGGNDGIVGVASGKDEARGDTIENDECSEIGICLPFDSSELVPPMPLAGTGHRIHMTGLTHDDRGYPATEPGSHKKLMDRLLAKVRSNMDDIVEIEEMHLDDAEVAVVVYGSEARPAWKAVQLAREEGIKVGMMRLITAWPFPEKQIESLGRKVKKIIMPEVNYGQMVHMVREFADCDVISMSHPGGAIHRPSDIIKTIREAIR